MPAEPHRSGRTNEGDVPARTDRINRPDRPTQPDRPEHDRDRHLTEADVYPRRPGWPKWVALAVGVFYTVITVVSAVGIGVTEVNTLGHLHLVAGFGVSWFLLAAHAGTAVWGLLAPVRRSATKLFGTVVFVAYLGLSAYSVPEVIAEAEYLNVGWGNAVVYVLTAATGLAIAIGAAAGKPFPQEPPPESNEVM